MRFHLVNLPHASTTAAYSWCAFTTLNGRFAKIMHERGHEVFLYAGPENDYPCTEHIQCTKDELPPNGTHPVFSAEDPNMRAYNRRCIEEIRQRIEPEDFICITGGRSQEEIANSFSNQTVEHLVCYAGVCPNTRKIFCSQTWRHAVLGAGGPHEADGHFFDTVIPFPSDEDENPLGTGGDYAVYVGRLIERKGVGIAVETAKRMGMELHVAGQGPMKLPDWVNYHGVLKPQERSELVQNARVSFVPSLYLEPFGLVVTESHLCGTPTVTTPWGAFVETVQPWRNGFHAHTISEFVEGAAKAAEIDRELVRASAWGYTLNPIGRRYEDYFDRLTLLRGRGFYS